MSTVRKEPGVQIVKDDVHMDKSPIKVSEVKQLIKQADQEHEALTDEEVRSINVEAAGGNVQLEPGVKQDHPGRPIDTGSKRQQELLRRAIKQELGILRKGRPVDLNSPRQQRLHELKEKREAGLLRPGRPAYTPEEREQADKDKERRNAERMKEITRMAKELIAKQSGESETQG